MKPAAPICHYHLRAMRLVDCHVPRFASASLSHQPVKWNRARKIWRCPVALCPCVENGPVIEQHSTRELSMTSTNPW